MRLPSLPRTALTIALLCGAATAGAQHADTAPRLAAQREAMKPLAWMDGIWRGPAWTVLPDGRRHTITQTERIGTFLGGTVRVVEGRGYEPDGKVSFNALGTIAFDMATRRYTFYTHAQGYSGVFPLTPTADGYIWETKAGPDAVMRYTASFKDGRFREIGEYVRAGEPPRQTFEMNLERIGDTSWPADGAVPPR